jgi:hypothetical protein
MAAIMQPLGETSVHLQMEALATTSARPFDCGAFSKTDQNLVL